MSNRQVKVIVDNNDKSRTYSEMMQKYKKAIHDEFYFEAMLIEYAMLEDRTLSFLYHCGIQTMHSCFTISNISKKKLLHVSPPADGEKVKRYSLNGLKNKLDIIALLLEWEEKPSDEIDDRYLKTLKNQLESLDIELIQKTISDIYQWKDYRNEIIHGLLNKNIDNLQLNLSDMVEEGMRLARIIDDQVKILKKGNRIRRAANLPV